MKDYSEDITEIEGMMRIGTVIKVSGETASVKFEEYDDMISADLPIVYRRRKWVPDLNDTVLCLFMPHGDGDGYIIGRF